ncbi:hypothetical protein COOONC_10159 [Cooperia oncophora]
MDHLKALIHLMKNMTVIHHTIELFVPLKPQKTTGVQLPLHLIRCNRKKNSAWAKAVSSDNQADWDEYNKLRTTFEKRCRTIVSGDGGFTLVRQGRNI